jgi:uncharacterized protein DUF6600/FecR-like protein
MSGKALSRLLVSALFFALVSLPAWSDSQVRIVRLSYVDGGVQIDRGTGHFEAAIVNLPITQGMKLQTRDDGRAEVEFEDGSTLRLAPDTAVRFSQLSLRDSGDKISAVQITEGTAYADVAGTKGNQLTVEFGHEKLTLTSAVRVRVGVDDTGASVAVLKGDVQIDTNSGTVEAKKGQTANFDFTNNEKFTLAKNVQEYPYDSWDKQQDQFRQVYAAKNASNSYSPYAYGTADLAYYGNFFNAPGYGMLWQPYFVGTGWDPFMDGFWSFSPGWGFGWVSAYPWGWLPYHYGSWMFVPGYGWAWQPGGAWMPWYSQPMILNPPRGFTPPRAPASGTSTVAVNRGPVSVTKAGFLGSKLVIRNNSAGLGVPRGGIENLPKLSQRVEQHGSATQRVASEAPPQMGMGTGMPRTGPAHGASAPAVRAPRGESSSPRMSAPAPRMEAPRSAPPPPPVSTGPRK